MLAEGQSEEVLVTAGRKRVRKGSIQKKASRKGGVKGVCEIKDKGFSQSGDKSTAQPDDDQV